MAMMEIAKVHIMIFGNLVTPDRGLYYKTFYVSNLQIFVLR
jgi:hypothetical protein